MAQPELCPVGALVLNSGSSSQLSPPRHERSREPLMGSRRGLHEATAVSRSQEAAEDTRQRRRRVGVRIRPPAGGSGVRGGCSLPDETLPGSPLPAHPRREASPLEMT